MELKKYKRIRNTKSKFVDGTINGGDFKIASIWQNANDQYANARINGPYIVENAKAVQQNQEQQNTETVSDIAKNGNKSTGFGYSDMFQSMAASMVRGHADAAATREDFEREYQYGQGNIGGVGYQTVSFDANQKYKDSYKKWMGEMATDPLSALTRRADWLFTNIRDRWNKEQRLTTRTTNFNQNQALSQVIRNNRLQAKNGKNLPGFYNGSEAEVVVTPYGPAFGKPNAMVSSGEELVSGDGRSSFTVPGGKNNKDNIPAMLAEGTDGTAKTGDSIVLSNKNNAADYYRMTGDLYGAQMMNPAAKTSKGMLKAKCGKNSLPKYEDGDNARFSAWTSIFPNMVGMSTSLGQYIGDLLSHSPSYDIPNQNPYETETLDGLSKLRVPTLPTTNALRSAEGRARSAISQSGGLGAGQKTLSYLSAYNNTQRNIADALMNIQMQNNNYLSDYYKTKLKAGDSNIQRAMQASMYKQDMRDKQIASRRQVLGQDMSNWMGYLQNTYKQDSTRRMHNFIMDKYDQQQIIDKAKLDADTKAMEAVQELAREEAKARRAKEQADANKTSEPKYVYTGGFYNPFNTNFFGTNLTGLGYQNFAGGFNNWMYQRPYFWMYPNSNTTSKKK